MNFGSRRISRFAVLCAAVVLSGCAQLPELTRSLAGYNISAPPSRSGETIILGKDDVIRVSELSVVEYQQHLTILTRAFEREAPFAVYFSLGGSTLDQAAIDNLDAQAAWIKAHPQVRVSVTGHTDDVGDPAYNYALGMRRARAVVAHLVQSGINRERLIALESSGEAERAVALSEGFLSNRRAVTSVIEIVEPRNAGAEDTFAELDSSIAGSASVGGSSGSGGSTGGSGGSTGGSGGSTGGSGGSTGGSGGSTGGSGGSTGGSGGGSGGSGGGSGGSGGGGGGSACGSKDC